VTITFCNKIREDINNISKELIQFGAKQRGEKQFLPEI
jgi:hypothetical protein